MIYALISIALFLSLLVYFKLADYFNIIDKPNERSSHTVTTIRGGGIVFPLALIFYTFLFGQVSYILISGALAISLISFLDDLYTLPSRTRVIIHLLSVSTLIYVSNGIYSCPMWLIPIFFILVIGCINAYNFMDGINGITGLYSLVAFGSLYYVNRFENSIDGDFILTGILACIVFLYFNFRKRAKCFAGDVGSVSVAFWIIVIIILLILDTGNLKYVLFLSVYGTDAILTIIHRLILKQNIFDAHRLHFYQILANDQKIPHLYVSAVYAGLQLFLNFIIIQVDLEFYWLFLLINLPLCLIYITLKPRLMLRIVK
jgi:UDP-N-acetylmuramyl pentapeptide phosphotransferase/UDP-N-acetylglucosamine-1-phosphate transferase